MTKKKRIMAAAAMIASMVFLAAFSGLNSILLTNIIDAFSLSGSEKGCVNTAMSIGSVIALLGSFFIVGRVSKTKLLAAVTGLCGLALIVLKWIPGLAVFLLIWCFIGIFTVLIDTLSSAVMANLYTGPLATKMMCSLHLCYSGACVLFPVLYNGMLKNGADWKDAYLVTGIIGLAFFVFILFAVRGIDSGGSEKAPAVHEKKITGSDILHMIKTGNMPGYLLAMFCIGLYMSGMGWTTRYISETLGSNLGGLASSFIFFGVMVCRLITTFFTIDTVKYLKLYGLVAGAALLIAIPIQNPVVMSIAICFCGFCYGASIPCVISSGTQEFPENTLLVTTIMGCTKNIASAISSPIMGAIETAFNLHVGMAACAVSLILASLCAFMIKEKKS